MFNLSERRLARLLIVLADPDQKGEAGEVIINQEALAEMVGTTRSRISTFMNKFRDKGFISYDSHGRRIVVYLRPIAFRAGELSMPQPRPSKPAAGKSRLMLS